MQAMLLAGAKVVGARSMGRKRKSTKKPTVEEQRGNPLYWPEVTNPKGYRYYFHPKHHRGGNTTESRWKPDVSRQEEFTIFEVAVRLDLADEDGDLYNVRKAADGAILDLGVFHEQIARFWKPTVPTDAWHGHPLWPVGAGGPSNRAKQANRPSRSVFRKLVEQGVLSEAQRHRLNNGKNV
jgi:hypothetical protein